MSESFARETLNAVKEKLGMSDDLDELTKAEQRGYANAMEAERKLHEDRIEQLELERDEAVTKRAIAEGLAGLKAFGIDGHSAMIALARDQVSKRMKAEAKLAKAVESLRGIIPYWDKVNPLRFADQHNDGCDCYRCAFDKARTTLAKLEGK
jgi:hypothetical protein